MIYHIRHFLIVFSLLILSSSVFAQRPALIPFRKGDFWGYSDSNKVMKIPVRFEEALPFENGVAIVQTTNDQALLIDEQGKTVKKLKYRINESHQYGLVIFHDKKNYLTGLMDLQGKVIVKPIYTSIEIISRDTFEVIKPEGKKGKITRSGEIAEPFVDFEDTGMPPFEEIANFVKPTRTGDFSEGLAIVQNGTKFGFCNTAMKLVVDCKYERAEEFYGGLARVLIVAPGQEILEPYEDENGMTVVHATILAEGYIDRFGNEYWSER